MPNWMKIKLEASNCENFDFRRDFKSFNDIVKMPSLLQRVSSDKVSDFVKENQHRGLAWLLKTSKHGSIRDIARSYRAITQIGYESWYDWRLEHWGVKWDMDIVDVTSNNIDFDVPWCIPEQVVVALFQQYPDVIFTGEFAEEQPGYFSGTFDSCGGQISIFYDLEFTNEAYERYFSFWGGEEDYQLINSEYTYIDNI